MKILNILTFLYHVEQDTCTAHGRNIKTRYFGLILILRSKKGLTFYQTRSNAIVLQGILPAYCIPKVVRMKTGEVLYEKSYVSPRPPPKISLRHDHDWTRVNDELGSTVEQEPVGKLVQQSCGELQHEDFSQPTQPKPKPICDRSGKPELTEDVFVSRSHEIDEKRLHKELGSSDRTGKTVRLSEDIRVKHASFLRKLYIYSMKNNTSDEDKHDTNYINNKYTNTCTRKLHNL